MRTLEKGPQPVSLASNAIAWRDELLAAPQGSEEYRRIQARYRRDDIRDALRDETSRKCAYCEGYVEAYSYDHIEHIEPKTPKPELTFDWDNLTLACTVCNVNKGDDLPDATNFVHPYNDAPEQRFHFLGGLIQAAPADVAAQNMINWLDLNRAGLIIQRSELVKRLTNIFEQALGLPQESRAQFIELSLRPLCKDSSPHSRVILCASEALSNHYAAALAAA
jgi:uncharacterized protein (TIGR02646 family)